jgi:hypothetical protein
MTIVAFLLPAAYAHAIAPLFDDVRAVAYNGVAAAGRSVS